MNFKQKKHLLLILSVITLLIISCTYFAFAEDAQGEQQQDPATTEQPASEENDGETPASEEPTSEQPAGEENDGDTPASEEPADEEPVEEQPTRTVYVMTVEGKSIMTVSSRAEGRRILKLVVKSLIPKDSKMSDYEFEEKVQFKKVEQKGLLATRALKAEDDAVMYLRKKMRSSNPPLTLTITSNKYRTKKTPVLVKFKYKENMYDFEFKVARKGTKGKARTRYEYKSINGKIVSKEKKETKTIKKGKYTIIYTGRKKTPKNITYKKYKNYKAKVEKDTYKKYGNIYLGINLVNYGKKFLGNPYRVGGMSLTHGIDCVGFVRALYKKFGITLPGNRWKLYHYGKKVSYKNARPGDVVFYGPHPAIYMGNGKIISARKSGIRISNIGYKKWTYIRRMR